MPRSHQTFRPVLAVNLLGDYVEEYMFGPPLFTLVVQPKMPKDGVRTDRCDQPLSKRRADQRGTDLEPSSLVVEHMPRLKLFRLGLPNFVSKLMVLEHLWPPSTRSCVSYASPRYFIK